jgi:hypothetical protein
MPVWGVVECCLCARMFRCELGRVYLVSALGARRPVCLACLQAANRRRTQRGLPLLTVTEGAYESPSPVLVD